MAESASRNFSKKLIEIDISSDTVCPWCFVGKKNLDKAIDASKDQYNFEIFKGIGLEYDTSGLTGNTLDSHRLIHYTGKQAPDKQHSLVEELCLGYFTQGKYIGDREFLAETAKKLGIDGAEVFLSDPSNGTTEVKEELEKYSQNITGVPYYTINGKVKLSGAQPPETFQSAFEAASS
uniref:DSBA-like thioredoxin domain-containing protein n=1 Tax=Brassica campestris TaxID=3711 RepID=M4EI08_BRACM